MIDITPILNAFITLIAAIITLVVIPKLRELLKTKIGAEQTQELCRWVDIFVGAAEQLFADSQLRKTYVEEQLATLGYTITPEVDGVIEAAVLQLHNSLK